MEKVTVTFYPNKKQVQAEKGATVLSAALSAGIDINSSCGGEGVCGRCKVIIKSGVVEAQPTGRISHDERSRGVVLACLATIEGDVEVEIPPESFLALDAQARDASDNRLKGMYSDSVELEKGASLVTQGAFTYAPFTTKLYLEIPAPNFDDKISDTERLYRAIRHRRDAVIMQTGLANIRRLGILLRSSDWKVTAVLGNRGETIEIISLEPGDTSGRNFGVAFDIGTTTISGQLVDLNTQEILGTKAKFNKQATFGSDIITRIIFAQKEEGMEKLHHAVIDGMNEIIHGLIQEHGVDLNDVTCCLCAGNTTMTHLLLKIDPTYIRREPYVPTANFVPVIRAAEAGIRINPRGLLACAPGVASYVGGDITSGILSCGIAEKVQLSLLIDIGTNGEIALGNKEWLISCAASAGPAFEGSGVDSGMRAVSGAIQKVAINSKTFDVTYKTIGDAPAKGICGSGYIDLLAAMLKAGIMDKNGKLRTEKRNPRIRKNATCQEFVVVPKEQSATAKDIVITETDIDNLKRAKGAIFAATSILLVHLDLKLDAVEKIFIAGGFGTALDVESAVAIGLLPDVARQKIIFVGNSSLSGARQMLLSSVALSKTEEIAKKTTYFELSTEPKYMEEYVSALFFPHTELERFPSVKV